MADENPVGFSRDQTTRLHLLRERLDAAPPGSKAETADRIRAIFAGADKAVADAVRPPFDDDLLLDLAEVIEARNETEQSAPPPFARVDATQARADRDFIAFAACSGQLLRVRQSDQRAHKITCPSNCREKTHKTFSARPRRRADKRCIVTVEDTPARQRERTSAERSDAAARVPDAALLAALPADDTLVRELAVSLGYAAQGGNMLRRLRQINKRAENKGELPPITITTQGRGEPALIRRNAEASP